MKLNGHMIGYGILFVVILILLNMALAPKKGAESAAAGGSGIRKLAFE